VQAVGKPNLANRITGATSYTATCVAPQPTPPPTPAPTPTLSLSFSAAPVSLTIPAGMAGSLTVTAKLQSGSLNSPIALSCSGIPSTLNCSFSPATITPGSSSASSTLTISTTTAAATKPPQPKKFVPILAGWLLPFGLVGVGFLGKGSRKRGIQALALCGVIGLGMMELLAAASEMCKLPVLPLPLRQLLHYH